eukprot:jgi/Mesvir1/23278/Mv25129-RA.2
MAVVAVAVKLIGVLVAGDELVGALAAREGIPRALAHTLQMCLFHLQRGSTQGARCGGGSGGGARSGGGANNNGGGSSAAAVASDRPRPPTMWVTLAIVRLAKVSQRALSSLTLAFGSVATLASLACLDTLDAASRACVSHGLVCLLQSFRGENAQSLAYESLMAHKGSPPASAGAGSIVVGAPGIGTLLRLPGTLQGRVVPSSSAAASSRSPSSPPTDNSPPHEPIWCDFPGCVVVNVAKVCLQVMAASRPRVVSAQAQAQVQSQAQAQAQARHRVPAAATAVPGACMPNSSLSGHGVSSRGGAGADGSSYENGSDSALVVGHAGSGSAGAGNYHGASVQVGGGGGGGAGLVAGASSNSYGGNGGGVASRASSDPASLRYNAMAEAGRVLCWLLLSPRSRCILRLVRERGGLGLLLDLAEMQCCSCETRCLAVEAAVRVARVDGSASNNGANSGNGSNGSGTAGAAAAGHGALEQARRGDGQGAGAKGVVAREEVAILPRLQALATAPGQSGGVHAGGWPVEGSREVAQAGHLGRGGGTWEAITRTGAITRIMPAAATTTCGRGTPTAGCQVAVPGRRTMAVRSSCFVSCARPRRPLRSCKGCSRRRRRKAGAGAGAAAWGYPRVRTWRLLGALEQPPRWRIMLGLSRWRVASP